MKCISPECVFLVNSDATNNDGSHCCVGCMKSSGKTHGAKCEKNQQSANVYTQNIAGVNAAEGLQTWTKAQIDSGLGLASDYRKTTKGLVITISGSVVEIDAVYSKITGTKIPESETDTYEATGKLIRFVDAANKTLSAWSEVTHNASTDTFYIATVCSDKSKYDDVLVVKA